MAKGIEEDIAGMARWLLPLARTRGRNATAVPGLWLYCEKRASPAIESKFSTPVISLGLQGRKRLVIAGAAHEVSAGTLIVHASNVPMQYQVLEASPEKPLLTLVAELDRALLAELTGLMPAQDRSASVAAASLRGSGPAASMPAPQAVASAFAALSELALQPDPVQTALLLPAIKRILHARLLLGGLGGWLRAVCDEGGHAKQIMTAISAMQSGYAGEIAMEDIARSIGMSSASFFRHFRRFAGVSPLQYLKALRLMKARALLSDTALSVSSVAEAVGYRSSSQFSSDYRRFFNEYARSRACGYEAASA